MLSLTACLGLLCAFFLPASSYQRTLADDGIDVACEYKNCSGHGTCKLGMCSCFDGWQPTQAGDDCEAMNNCDVQKATYGSQCSGKGLCAETSLNYPAIKAANGERKAKCTCSHSSIWGERCQWSRSPTQAAIRYEGSLVSPKDSNNAAFGDRFIVKGGKRLLVTAGNCFVAKNFLPVFLSEDEWEQIEASYLPSGAPESGASLSECAERMDFDDGVVALKAGAHPNVGNTLFTPNFDCEDVRKGGSSFDDGASGDYYESAGWCGETAYGQSFTQLSVAGTYDDSATPGYSNPGGNIKDLVNGMSDNDFEELGKDILELRTRSLEGKLAFQVSWPLGGADYLDDSTNNANQELALIWSKWSSFINLDGDEIYFTGNDKFNANSGETATFLDDPRDNVLTDQTQTARLFAKPQKLALRRTQAPTSNPTSSPTKLSERQYPPHSCRSGYTFGSESNPDANHCANALTGKDGMNKFFPCSCDKTNCHKTANIGRPCCFDVALVCK
jgi:hypothetical protein